MSSQHLSDETPKVFIDTSIIKFATENTVMRPRQQQLEWGDKLLEVTVHDIVTRRELDSLPNSEVRNEALLLRPIAELAKSGKISLITQAEVVHESWTLPWVRGAHLYGAEIEWVNAPIQYSRILGRVIPSPPGSRHNDLKESTVDFLKSVDHARFRQLQVACGAHQGAQELNENQLIDAFHVWCAEAAGARYFLTCDFKLIRIVRGHKRYPPRVSLVRPSELLADLSALSASV